jgi:hypothetical protein
LPGLFAASNTGHPHASFCRHSFCGPAHMQHIAFLFSIEKENSGENKKSKSCPTAQEQKRAPEKLAQS